MIVRGQNFKQIPINVTGSSTFGKFPKISNERTYNMYISDNFLVPYAGYKIAIHSNDLVPGGFEGRGVFTSTKFNRIVTVIDNSVFLIDIDFNQTYNTINFFTVTLIGQLDTYSGVVYITENNKPQIAISDNVNIYIYDPSASPVFQKATQDGSTPLSFTPGYITFHDTYFLCAASNDTYNGAAVNNTWRLSNQNNGLIWPDTASFVGLLQSKPDNTQAVVRFPSKGNMIFVMGSITTEAWFDTGAQLFPYQRNNQFNIDYGCLSPATVAYMDEIVVWLASNEKSGPIIMYSDGGMPKKITTDGIDLLFSTFQHPEDSQAFLYRQDGHMFYHINFYSDNVSFFYDFNTDKFYHATDQNGNYFIAAEIAFFGNQYYFVTKNNANFFAFDTGFYTYQDVLKNGTVVDNMIPRFRTCGHLRDPDQSQAIINDIGFTIESGETDYQYMETTDSAFLLLDNTNFLLLDGTNFNLLDPLEVLPVGPEVELSMSYDGGASFGNAIRYQLPGIGYRRNMLRWWQCGFANDAVPCFRFYNIGRVTCTDGVANLRY